MFDQKAMRELLDSFLAEFEEGADLAEQELLALERAPGNSESIDAVFRIVHTVKGNAGIFEFMAVTSLAHAMEDLLDRMRKRTAASSDTITLLLRAFDSLRTIVRDSIAGPRQFSEDERQLVRELAAAAKRKGRRADAQILPHPEIAPSSREERRTLRVDVSRLDRLLDLSGEIGIARGRVLQLLADPATPRSAALEAQRDSTLLHMEMQELIMKLRMVPVGPMFRQLLRTIRDTARSLGKQAELRIEGDDVEVDTAVVEQLRDPLVHMVRNSVGHGIEMPEVRERLGKPAAGGIVLRSFHEAGSIVIELEDDGAGLDRDRILERAVSEGLADATRIPPDDELFDLLFRPGFSTTKQVSDLSGRGVGLDVARRNIEAIHGTISISSVAGSGTKLSIRLPLTLAIIDGLQVGVGGESYIIPMEAVVEALDVPAGASDGDEATGLIGWRGGDIPFIRLRHRLGAGHEERRTVRERAVVVRSGEDARAALIVDHLHGECQTVVKPLARLLRDVAGISGSAILPDGKIAFIVDVPDLIQTESTRRRSGAAAVN